VKGIWRVVTKSPKVEGSEKWGVKCREVLWNEVMWSEVMFLGVILLLSLICSFVYLCSFFAVLYLIIIIRFSLLFSNYSKYFYNILFMLMCIFIIYLVYSVFLYSFLFFSSVLSESYFCTSLPTSANGWKPNYNI